VRPASRAGTGKIPVAENAAQPVEKLKVIQSAAAIQFRFGNYLLWFPVCSV
jgi:hypothetical protein